jgi:hypothetical protein
MLEVLVHTVVNRKCHAAWLFTKGLIILEIIFQTCIELVFGSESGIDTGYPNFPKSFDTNAGIVHWLGYDWFFPNHVITPSDTVWSRN